MTYKDFKIQLHLEMMGYKMKHSGVGDTVDTAYIVEVVLKAQLEWVLQQMPDKDDSMDWCTDATRIAKRCRSVIESALEEGK